MVRRRSLSSEIVQGSIANLDNPLLDDVLNGTASRLERDPTGIQHSLPNAEFELSDPLGDRIHHLLFHGLGCGHGSHDELSMATSGSVKDISYGEVVSA